MASTSSSKGTKRKVEDIDENGTEYLRRKHNFIKSSIRTDYQPDICKDYKETGFCGFGDSCKFLHDRSDYKHGWQLEQEWAKGQYKDEDDDKYVIKDGDGEEEADGIPFKCIICKETYKNPIMTKCKHYFCIDCAEKECNEKCFVCEEPTSGIFKNASKIIYEKIAKHKSPTTGNNQSDSDSDSDDDTNEALKEKEPEDVGYRESDDDTYYD